MATFRSLFFFAFLSWICSLETSAGHSQDDSDLLLKVVRTLFDDNEISHVKEIHSKKQASSDIKGVHTGNKHTSGSNVRNADKRNTGDTRHVENDGIQSILDTKDVNEEDRMLLKELEAFLSSNSVPIVQVPCPFGHTGTGRFYKNPVLKKVKEFYNKKRPSKGWSGVHLIHDNASSHNCEGHIDLLNVLYMCNSALFRPYPVIDTRAKQRWIGDEPSVRASTYSPSTTTPPQTPPPPTNPPATTTTTTTTPAPPSICTGKINGGWWWNRKTIYFTYFC